MTRAQQSVIPPGLRWQLSPPQEPQLHCQSKWRQKIYKQAENRHAVRSIEAGTDSGQRYSAHVCVNASSKRREDTHASALAASTSSDSQTAAHLLGQHAFGSYGLVMPCPLAQLADIPDVKHDSSSTPASACFRPLYMMS
eukprot:11183-Heterococcus_DN1.PRE.2